MNATARQPIPKIVDLTVAEAKHQAAGKLIQINCDMQAVSRLLRAAGLHDADAKLRKIAFEAAALIGEVQS